MPGAIDGALRAGIDPEAVFSAFVRSYDANLLTAVRSAAVADELGHDTDEAWVAAALEPRRTHHEGVAKRLGIPKTQARNLDSPTVTVKQQPHSPLPVEGHPVRQSCAEFGKVTMDRRA